MGRVTEIVPTRETESGEETLRVVAVETAWRLIRRHPNLILIAAGNLTGD